MIKACIVIFLIILALIDLAGIFGSDIKKAIEKRKSKKRMKAFAKKMKNLEIK